MNQTERLIFSSFQSQDFIKLYKLFCENEKVMSTALKGRLFTVEELRTLVAEQFMLSETADYGFCCVQLKENGTFIGIAGLIPCDHLGMEEYEFGFVLDDAYWGQGFATEIGAHSIQYAREVMGLDRVLATVSPQNLPSIRVLEKLGMTLYSEIMVEGRGARLVYVV